VLAVDLEPESIRVQEWGAEPRALRAQPGRRRVERDDPVADSNDHRSVEELAGVVDLARSRLELCKRLGPACRHRLSDRSAASRAPHGIISGPASGAARARPRGRRTRRPRPRRAAAPAPTRPAARVRACSSPVVSSPRHPIARCPPLRSACTTRTAMHVVPPTGGPIAPRTPSSSRRLDGAATGPMVPFGRRRRCHGKHRAKTRNGRDGRDCPT
jgi:hypothetical protein